MPNRKVPTTFVCHWRPRRRNRRQFTVNDAARVACEVTSEGRGTFAQIETRYREVCNFAGRRPQAAGAEAQAVAVMISAENALNRTNGVLEQDYETFLLVNQLLQAALVVFTLLPLGRVLRLLQLAYRRLVPAGSSVGLVEARLQSIQVQQAANTATQVVLRQAANDLSFKIRAGQ